MNKEIRTSIEKLQTLFTTELKDSIKFCIKDSNPYGYALMLGEDLVSAAPIAVTNSEADLEDPNDLDIRYIPNEWQEWHHQHFSGFTEKYKNIYQEFCNTHEETDSSFIYTPDAIEFMNTLYSMYLESFKSVTNEFPSIWYWIIWIPNSGREIVKSSFLALNTGKALEEAEEFF